MTDNPMSFDPPDTPHGEDVQLVALTEGQWMDLEYALGQYSGWAAITGRKDVARRYQEILYEVEDRG